MRAQPFVARCLALAVVLTLVACAPAPPDAVDEGGAPARLRVEVSYAAGLHEGPLTGRLFLGLSPTADPQPRIAAYNSARQRDGRVPFFAADLAGVGPSEPMVIDAAADGYPYARLGELPPGDYWVQALVHVYTEYRRQDGHVVWAPQDQWEGQRWAFSPGNLVSAPQRVRVDPASDTSIRLELTDEIPPIDTTPDTEWVKRVKMQSRILSDWWGHPMYLGAVVLLPRGYDDHRELRYPVVFEADHFKLEPAFGFTTEQPSGGPRLFAQMLRESGGMRESGYDFQRAWTDDDFPRMIAVTIQHPTPFFDDSYGLNSANNGPYGDAIHQELIPYLEESFRMIGQPYARVITGGSTGGWISLASQIHYPTFYGGTWTFYPGSGRLPALPVDRHLRGRERVPGPECRAGRAGADVPADDRGTAGRQRPAVEPARAGAGVTRPLRRADRRLERGVRSDRRGRLPAAAVGSRDGCDRPRGGAPHAGQRIRPAALPGGELVPYRSGPRPARSGSTTPRWTSSTCPTRCICWRSFSKAPLIRTTAASSSTAAP